MNAITRKLIHPNIKVEKDGVVLDYNAFIALINKWHTVFDELGLVPGDGYSTYGNFNPEIAALLIAGGERGLVFHAVVNIATINSLVNQNAIKAVFKNTDDSIDLEPFTTEIDFLISDVHTRPEHHSPLIVANKDSAFISGYTSGTTGESKCYTHSHHSFLIGALHIAKTRYKPTDVVAGLGCILHIALIGIQTLPVLIAGAHIIYFYDPTSALIKYPDKDKYNKITVPQGLMLDRVQDHARWNDLDLSYIEEFITGGASLDKERMVKPLLNKGVKKIVSLYGCSEMGIVAALEVTKDSYKQQFSDSNFPLIGDFFPFVDAIVDDKGELMVKSESIAPGVYTEGGYFKPYDNIEIINGKWYVKGRVDRVGRIHDVLVNLTVIDYCIRQFHREGVLLFKSCYSFINNDKLYLAIDCDAAVQNTVTKEELSAHITKIMKIVLHVERILFATPTIVPGGIKSVWPVKELIASVSKPR